MKKILIVALSTMISLPVFAGFGDVWQSSYTQTADTAKSLCSDVIAAKRKGTLHGVCVGSAVAGTISIFNAYSTGVNPVAVVSSTAAMVSGCLFYDVNMSSGIVYTTDTAGNKTTFLYQCD